MSPFHALPPELILEIFKIGCTHKQTLLSISLVSSWARELTLAPLFHTVVLRTAHQIHTFLHILTLHPPSWLATHLKNLWVTYPDPGRLCAPIFRLCTGTARVALQSNLLHLRNERAYSLCTLMDRCVDLTLIGPTFPANFEDLAPFRTVTHLRLVEPLSGPWYTGRQIAKMESLTHVCMVFQEPSVYAGEIFEEVMPILKSAMLEMVVLQMNQKHWVKNSSGSSTHRSINEWRFFASTRDSRLRILGEGQLEFCPGEWEKAARGGESVWERAAREHDVWKTQCLDDHSSGPEGSAIHFGGR